VEFLLSLFFSFFILIGLALIGWTIFSYRKAQEALSWPTASGKILSSALRHEKGGEISGYEPEILYKYQAYGVHHIADVIQFGGIPLSPKKEAQRIVEQYPIGREITVYFNPNKPAQAVLEPGKIDWVTAVIGVGCVVIGLMCLLRNGHGPSPHFDENLTFLLW
jgi:hypothetical protein